MKIQIENKRYALFDYLKSHNLVDGRTRVENDMRYPECLGSDKEWGAIPKWGDIYEEDLPFIIGAVVRNGNDTTVIIFDEQDTLSDLIKIYGEPHKKSEPPQPPNSFYTNHKLKTECKFVDGTYPEVVKECARLASEGWKYSKVGYVKLDSGLYERRMYLFSKEE